MKKIDMKLLRKSAALLPLVALPVVATPAHAQDTDYVQSGDQPRRTVLDLARRPGKPPGLGRLGHVGHQAGMLRLHRGGVDRHAPAEPAREK